MSVDGSAGEFMLIHALGRERFPALCCGLLSNPLKILVFVRWETIGSFCLCFPHTSRQVYFLWAPATHHRL